MLKQFRMRQTQCNRNRINFLINFAQVVMFVGNKDKGKQSLLVDIYQITLLSRTTRINALFKRKSFSVGRLHNRPNWVSERTGSTKKKLLLNSKNYLKLNLKAQEN